MLVTLTRIEEARCNIVGIALRTPLLRLNTEGSGSAGQEIYLKLESLQPIGAFKIRGAANCMARVPREQLARGVFTASAGNMAQGVAYCARRMGISATVIAPENAPETKTRAVERMGGRVIRVPRDQWWQTFETRSFPGVDGTFIHAFDDDDVMAGNGTIGLEIIEDLPDLVAVVIPWGGGGLACGIASAVKALKPGVRVFAAETETGAPLSASWAAGKPVEVAYQPSFIDGISAKTVFPRMFEEAKRLLDGSIVVTVADAISAMKLVAERSRLIIEGAAACAVAAALSGKAGPGKVVAIVSGGNIDLAKFAELVG
ncbi:MAG TPA: threonine/serine dehydratase [Bryobacteraceae bacterium]|nr:threonine/serine dehydratase [Bryobacteraceae bacterium]